MSWTSTNIPKGSKRNEITDPTFKHDPLTSLQPTDQPLDSIPEQKSRSVRNPQHRSGITSHPFPFSTKPKVHDIIQLQAWGGGGKKNGPNTDCTDSPFISIAFFSLLALLTFSPSHDRPSLVELCKAGGHHCKQTHCTKACIVAQTLQHSGIDETGFHKNTRTYTHGSKHGDWLQYIYSDFTW